MPLMGVPLRPWGGEQSPELVLPSSTMMVGFVVWLVVSAGAPERRPTPLFLASPLGPGHCKINFRAKTQKQTSVFRALFSLCLAVHCKLYLVT